MFLKQEQSSILLVINSIVYFYSGLYFYGGSYIISLHVTLLIHSDYESI
jgi:hypothetical protein